MSGIVFIDTEFDTQTRKVSDYGAVNSLRDKLHTKSENDLQSSFREINSSADTIS